MYGSDEFLNQFVDEMRRVMEKHDLEKGCLWKNQSVIELNDNHSSISELPLKW